MRQTQIVLGVTVLALGILSAVPGLRATERSDVHANADLIGESFASDESEGVRISLPFQTVDVIRLCGIE